MLAVHGEYRPVELLKQLPTHIKLMTLYDLCVTLGYMHVHVIQVGLIILEALIS